LFIQPDNLSTAVTFNIGAWAQLALDYDLISQLVYLSSHADIKPYP
jgi:hypothetical protein